MFLIFGVNQKEKQLNFDQVVVCNCCGKYGHITVWVTYSYFMFFFLPLFTWGRRYYVRMSCCGAVTELDAETGRRIEDGELHSLDIKELHFGKLEGNVHKCSQCGYVTTEDFQFCPKCGNKF